MLYPEDLITLRIRMLILCRNWDSTVVTMLIGMAGLRVEGLGATIIRMVDADDVADKVSHAACQYN